MLKMKDILPGDCWRFTLSDESAPDHHPTITVRKGQPTNRPRGWDTWEWDAVDTSEYMEEHGHREIELLVHPSKNAAGVPLNLRRKDLKPGDCFHYLRESDFPEDGSLPQFRIVEGPDVSVQGMPRSWGISSATKHGRPDDLVRCVPHWSGAMVTASTAHLKVLATSTCGGYVVVASTDVPAGVVRSQRSTTLEAAIEDEVDDLESMAGGKFRGPHPSGFCWMAKPAPRVPDPVILSGIDPLKDLRDAVFVREEKTVDGIKGHQCLWRYEEAQRTESLARPRTDEDKLVSTNAMCALTEAQVEHARDLWSYKLRLKVAEQKLRDEEKRARNLCDDPDEMPNMVYVNA
jgi:hypothetical protein